MLNLRTIKTKLVLQNPVKTTQKPAAKSVRTETKSVTALAPVKQELPKKVENKKPEPKPFIYQVPSQETKTFIYQPPSTETKQEEKNIAPESNNATMQHPTFGGKHPYTTEQLRQMAAQRDASEDDQCDTEQNALAGHHSDEEHGRNEVVVSGDVESGDRSSGSEQSSEYAEHETETKPLSAKGGKSKAKKTAVADSDGKPKVKKVISKPNEGRHLPVLRAVQKLSDEEFLKALNGQGGYKEPWQAAAKALDKVCGDTNQDRVIFAMDPKEALYKRVVRQKNNFERAFKKARGVVSTPSQAAETASMEVQSN